jgi:hypothetical protein
MKILQNWLDPTRAIIKQVKGKYQIIESIFYFNLIDIWMH